MAGSLTAARPVPSDSCEGAIAAAEAQYRLPAKLLATIGIVESGRADPVTGRTRSWPWTINVGGIGHFYASREEAIAAVAGMQAAGVHSIDIGCMQVNLMYHPDAFTSLDDAFEPASNVHYAARFLTALYHQTGNWPQAAAAYHSLTPEVGQGYEQKVMALWPLAKQFPDAGLGLAMRTDSFDYSRYTPQFAAALKQMRAEQASILQTVSVPADRPAKALGRTRAGVAAVGSQYTPEFAARLRVMQADAARLRPSQVAVADRPATRGRSKLVVASR